MSKNNQMLVKEFKDRFYIFDVMAESWYDSDDDKTNTLYTKDAKTSFPTREEAHKAAHSLDSKDVWGGSEYGVVDEVLFKDGAPVTVVSVKG